MLPERVGDVALDEVGDDGAAQRGAALRVAFAGPLGQDDQQ
jgi:hypothetical protein